LRGSEAPSFPLPLLLALAYLRNRKLWPWPAAIVGVPLNAVGLLAIAGAGLVMFGLLVGIFLLSGAVTSGNRRRY